MQSLGQSYVSSRINRHKIKMLEWGIIIQIQYQATITTSFSQCPTRGSGGEPPQPLTNWKRKAGMILFGVSLLLEKFNSAIFQKKKTKHETSRFIPNRTSISNFTDFLLIAAWDMKTNQDKWRGVSLRSSKEKDRQWNKRHRHRKGVNWRYRTGGLGELSMLRISNLTSPWPWLQWHPSSTAIWLSHSPVCTDFSVKQHQWGAAHMVNGREWLCTVFQSSPSVTVKTITWWPTGNLFPSSLLSLCLCKKTWDQVYQNFASLSCNCLPHLLPEISHKQLKNTFLLSKWCEAQLLEVIAQHKANE